jgi:hypothetical protein
LDAPSVVQETLILSTAMAEGNLTVPPPKGTLAKTPGFVWFVE